MNRKRIRARSAARRIAHAGKQNAGGRIAGESVSLGRAELVLAYELRQEGCFWSLIAKALGVTVDYLSRRIKQCERDGIEWIEY